MRTVIFLAAMMAFTVKAQQGIYESRGMVEISYFNSDEYTISESDVEYVYNYMTEYLGKYNIETDLDLDELIEFMIFDETGETIHRSYTIRKTIVKFYLSNNTVALKIIK